MTLHAHPHTVRSDPTLELDGAALHAAILKFGGSAPFHAVAQGLGGSPKSDFELGSSAKFRHQRVNPLLGIASVIPPVIPPVFPPVLRQFWPPATAEAPADLYPFWGAPPSMRSARRSTQLHR